MEINDAFKLVEQLGPPFTDIGIRVPLFIIQGVASALAFVVFPLIYLKYGQKLYLKEFFGQHNINPTLLSLVAILVIFFMIVNSVIIEWNQSWQLPQFFMDLESQAKELTTFLIGFTGIGELLLAMVVIALIPAIGEELVFRGLLQKMAAQFTGNHHLAIWLCAILFSAFHLQFLGFVPRLLLGALFGYLYAWSGTLWVPMFAHFVNNAFTILMVYLFQTREIDFDIEETSSVSGVTAAVFGILCFAILYFIKKTSTSIKDEKVAEGI